MYISRDRAYDICSDKNLNIGTVEKYEDNQTGGSIYNSSSASKRLLTQKEWRTSAYWGERELLLGAYGPHIENLEIGLPFVDTRKKDGTIINTGCNSSSPLVLRTGDDSTSSCISYFGIKDMVGNIWEWTSDEIECENYMCIGRTSSKDLSNTDLTNLRFDGTEAPGGRPDSFDWFIEDKEDNVAYFNTVLGIPLTTKLSSSDRTINPNLKLYSDSFALYPSGNYERRGLIVGGANNTGTEAGRWTSYWGVELGEKMSNVGVRCVLPVD